MTDYLAYIIQGALNGFGSAIGTYFAFKYGIDHIEKIPLVKEKVKNHKEIFMKLYDLHI
jgi:hypothetical protein